VGRPSAPERHWLVFSALQMAHARLMSLGRFLPRFLRFGPDALPTALCRSVTPLMTIKSASAASVVAMCCWPPRKVLALVERAVSVEDRKPLEAAVAVAGGDDEKGEVEPALGDEGGDDMVLEEKEERDGEVASTGYDVVAVVARCLMASMSDWNLATSSWRRPQAWAFEARRQRSFV